MQVKIQRYPKGVPIKYFSVDATTCDSFWESLKRPKRIFIRDINKQIVKPTNYLAFTFIGYDINYKVNQKTRIVEKLSIIENVIVYLPKWNQKNLKTQRLQNRYYSFLKKALYHEYKYHVYLYEEKQLNFLYETLKNLKNPTLARVSRKIRNFQTILIKEQEISHASAPRGKPFCLPKTKIHPFSQSKN